MNKPSKTEFQDLVNDYINAGLGEMADIMDKMTDLHEREGHEAQRKSLEPYNLAITEELIKRGLVSY